MGPSNLHTKYCNQGWRWRLKGNLGKKKKKKVTWDKKLGTKHEKLTSPAVHTNYDSHLPTEKVSKSTDYNMLPAGHFFLVPLPCSQIPL